MHIFCSAQYDLHFLFNVKLSTTHSTDVAATSVNSKNKFCPFAKALLHYFSNMKNVENQKKEKSISDLRFMDLPERVVAGLSTSSSSSIKARMTSSPPELMELKTCKRWQAAHLHRRETFENLLHIAPLRRTLSGILQFEIFERWYSRQFIQFARIPVEFVARWWDLSTKKYNNFSIAAVILG